MQHNWKSLQFTDTKTEYFSIGHLHSWIKLKKDEVWIAYRLSDNSNTQSYGPSQVPEDVEWTRWALKNDVSRLSVLPVLPDLPVMVYPEYPLKIAAGAKIRIFTRVASWVRIQTDVKEPVIICEMPTMFSSKTWFGSRYDGELCYTATTKTRRALSPDTYESHLINCAITIHNRSDKFLDFQSFCFRVGRLDVYSKENVLWSNETHIQFEGEDQLSEVVISSKPPAEADGSKLVTEARQKSNRNIASRTFNKIIKEIGIMGR